MIRFKVIFCSLVLLLSIFTGLQGASFVQVDEVKLAKVKQVINEGTASIETICLYNKLINNADKALDMPNLSVTHKIYTPPSGDKHDYLSISRYWWPNPATKDSLPWVRKDGITNPSTQTNDVDRNRFGRMTQGVQYLALAYYFSDNEKYAKKAAVLLRTWFLNKETAMNPHMQYAQSVPGIDQNRATGILDSRIISLYLLDAIELISDSGYWTDDDKAKMTKWLEDYLHWLTESPLGKKGALQENNHGSWYRFQIAALSWYLKKDELLKIVIEQTKQSFSKQFDERGAQVYELQRTKSFSYSCFNLSALTCIAIVAEKAAMPIWNYTTPDGKSLKLAINFLIPVAKGQHWDYPTLELKPIRLLPILGRVKDKIDLNEYDTVFKDLLLKISCCSEIDKIELRICEELYLLGTIQ